jgi:hypothetical protein
MALHGLNICMAVFTGISAYGLMTYFGIGAEAAIPTTAQTTLLLAAGVTASIAGICFFGMQLDRRKSEDRKTEELKAAEPRRKGKNGPRGQNA